MPLSTWLVIHQGDSSFSVTESSDRDTTPPLRLETSHAPRKSVRPRRLSATAHPVTAPEELMPRTCYCHIRPIVFPLSQEQVINESHIAAPSSLPHRFQQPPSTTPRGRHSLQADHEQSSGAIRMARTRIPRPFSHVEAEAPAETLEVSTPVLPQRRTQRFGIFCTAATGSGMRRTRGMTVPRSTP